MTEIEQVLIARDGMTAEEAHNLLIEMRDQVAEGMDPEEVLYDIGLEPDYVFDLLPF
jgi:hypothetical protein